MSATRRTRRTRLIGACAALSAATALPAAGATPAPGTPAAPGDRPHAAAGLPRSCSDADVPLTAEEALLTRPQARRLIEEGGFARSVARFERDLCRARSVARAERIVDRHGARLWRDAVDRAQGRRSAGTLSAGDDRPLYWARLAMAAAVRQWEPGFVLTARQRSGLIADLDRVSRGQEDISSPRGRHTRTMLVTGFDPFTLTRDIRQSNPSGAGALALDGVVLHTAKGPVRIETALFPVRWRDFGDGMVEDALRPWLAPGPGQVDAFATTSQGRPGRYDLEMHNGAWRAGFPDNEQVCYRGRVPIPSGVPTKRPQPWWTDSTLPAAAMVAAGTGPFTVVENRQVTEVLGTTPEEPATTACPAAPSPGTTRPDGPTPGSQARAGGGGNYLSNEIAYRATLLRDAVGAGDLPGGHIHTPVLTGLSATDADELTNPAFEANREAISAQTRALVKAAAEAAG